ncbi:hypothetical protein [Flavobacterium poyangense]|uniref:hypothetical protein n=1 Tax=Flavobacterium poyangense TaxID=2204302 RepID=UPI0014236936|nr:hypothetical protein [Flavobacterium sp. JXAS1]
MTDNLLKELKLNIFYRAKIFIENLQEFAPFGAKLIEGNIKDVVYSDDAEIIDCIKGIKILQDNFSEEIKNKTINAGAIAFDVTANFKNGDGISEKRDALCLKISTNGEIWSEDYFPYMIIDGECVWK